MADPGGIPKTSRREFLGTAAAAVLGGIACGVAPSGPAAGTPAPAATPAPAVRKTVELTYWYWADQPQTGEFVRRTIDKFNARQSAIRVTGEAQPNTTAAREKLVTTAAAAGPVPDVTYANTDFQQEFYTAGYSRPVEEYFATWDGRRDVSPEVIETQRIKPGQPLLYMPWGIVPDLHYYWTDFYQAAGVKPPDTFPELVAAARKLTDAPRRFGFGLRGADQFGFTWNFCNHLFNEGITFTDGKGGSDLDSPKAVETATTLLSLFWDQVAQPSALQDRFPQMVAQFQAGKIAQWGAGINHAPLLVGSKGEFDAVTGVTMIPRGENRKRFVPVSTAGNMLMKGGKNPEAAWEFVTYLMEPDVQEEFAKVVGFLPARLSVAERPYFKADRFFKKATESLAFAGNYPRWHKNWVKFTQTTGLQLWQRALQKQVSPEDLMKGLAQLMREV